MGVNTPVRLMLLRMVILICGMGAIGSSWAAELCPSAAEAPALVVELWENHLDDLAASDALVGGLLNCVERGESSLDRSARARLFLLSATLRARLDTREVAGEDVDAALRKARKLEPEIEPPDLGEPARLAWFRLWPVQEPRAPDPRRQLQSLGVPYSETEFLKRLDNEDLEAVNLFLQAGIRPHGQTQDGEPFLNHAVSTGNLQLVEVVLDALARDKSSLGVCDSEHYTALTRACKLGHDEIALELLGRGAPVWEATCDGSAAPFTVCMRADAQRPVEAMMRLEPPDEVLRRALNDAARRGLSKWVAALGTGRTDGELADALAAAGKACQPGSIGTLVELGASAAENPSLLDHAVRSCKPDVTRLLVMAGADPLATAESVSPLAYCAQRLESDCGGLAFDLIRHKDPDRYLRDLEECERPRPRACGTAIAARWAAPPFSALTTNAIRALRAAGDDVLLELLVGSVEVDANPDQALLSAAKACSPDFVARALSDGATAATTDNIGRSALHLALRAPPGFDEPVLDEACAELARKLVSSEFPFWKPDVFGRTAEDYLGDFARDDTWRAVSEAVRQSERRHMLLASDGWEDVRVVAFQAPLDIEIRMVERFLDLLPYPGVAFAANERLEYLRRIAAGEETVPCGRLESLGAVPDGMRVQRCHDYPRWEERTTLFVRRSTFDGRGFCGEVRRWARAGTWGSVVAIRTQKLEEDKRESPQDLDEWRLAVRCDGDSARLDAWWQ